MVASITLYSRNGSPPIFASLDHAAELAAWDNEVMCVEGRKCTLVSRVSQVRSISQVVLEQQAASLVAQAATNMEQLTAAAGQNADWRRRRNGKNAATTCSGRAVTPPCRRITSSQEVAAYKALSTIAFQTGLACGSGRLRRRTGNDFATVAGSAQSAVALSSKDQGLIENSVNRPELVVFTATMIDIVSS